MKRYVIYYISLLLCCCGTTLLHAQEEPSGTDEEETGNYSGKHIYDSSERFFQQRYSDDPFERISDTEETDNVPQKARTMKKDEAFWYVDAVESFKKRIDAELSKGKNGAPLPPAKQAFESDDGSSGTIPSSVLLGIAIVVFMAALFYFLASSKVGFFAPREIDTNMEVTTDEMGDNIFGLNYPELLKKALQSSNYRLAVRILYLQTLRQLNDFGYIRFQPDYTNIDYLIQLKSSSRYEDFARITRHYEYVWYGKFEVSKELFEKISADFVTVQNKLN